LPDTTGIIGSTIDLPVKINPVPAAVPIYAIQGIFSFNTSALNFLDVLTNAAGLENWGFTVNQDGNDLHFAAAGATPVMAGGVLFELRLKILAGASVGQKQTLQIKALLLNEGSPAALTSSGSVISQLAGPPEIPLLISPVSGSLDVPPFGAKFCWGTTVGAQRYTIQISGDTEFTSPAFEVANITDTCVVIDSLGAEKNYFWRVRAVNSLGESDWSEVWPFATTISGLRAGEDHGYPAGFILQQNYPNPFNPGTIIEFSLPERRQTTLQIYNALGELLETLINRTLNAGTHRVYWDARGRPSGVYYCRVRSGDYIAGRRMLLIR
jgi:hypothetical protein